MDEALTGRLAMVAHPWLERAPVLLPLAPELGKPAFLLNNLRLRTGRPLVRLVCRGQFRASRRVRLAGAGKKGVAALFCWSFRIDRIVARRIDVPEGVVVAVEVAVQ